MGAAIDSLRPAVSVTRDNPIFLATSLLALVGSAAASAVAGRIPVAGELVNSLFVTPAFAALLLGMAFAGLATDAASLGDGVETLRSSYSSLVGGYAILIGGVLVVVLAWVVEIAVLLILGPDVDPARGFTTAEATALFSSGPVLAVTFLALSLVLVGGLAVQFFDVAIVVSGESALSSFGASWRLFRDAPASVLGYSVLRLLPVVAAGLLVALGYRFGSSVADSNVGTLLAAVVGIAFGPATFAFVTAYHVAYYDERIGRRIEE